jgi:outer membrane beta-barrel protein
MSKFLLKSYFLISTLLVAPVAAFAQSNSSAMQRLGNQESLLDKADPQIPRNTYRVVQQRVIDRTWRSEFTLQSGMINGGDSYYSTNALGLQYELHVSPRWSFGLRHAWYFNELTSEGRRIFDRAEAQQLANPYNDGNIRPPILDYPVSQSVATVSFYPLYGKMSLFDASVSYFDVYVMLGGGSMQLERGRTGVATGGVGMGMWWTQHFSTRFEVRAQNYDDQAKINGRNVNSTVATFGIGLLI